MKSFIEFLKILFKGKYIRKICCKIMEEPFLKGIIELWFWTVLAILLSAILDSYIIASGVYVFGLLRYVYWMWVDLND